MVSPNFSSTRRNPDRSKLALGDVFDPSTNQRQKIAIGILEDEDNFVIERVHRCNSEREGLVFYRARR